MAGTTGWGGNYWGTGTWATGVLPPLEIHELVSLSEAQAVWLPLRVVQAIALTAYHVEVELSHDLDFGYAPVLDPANYSIPGLTVMHALQGLTANTVRLVTSEQGPSLYTLTVAAAQSVPGDPLSPSADSASFAGFYIQPSFLATAQSRTKVELIFTTAMLQNAAFVDAASYQVADLNGNTIAISTATASGTSPISRVTLALGAEMAPGGYYEARILSGSVTTTTGLPIYPEVDVFQWAEMAPPQLSNPLNIRIADMTGEVSGGLLGTPAGQIFFSPALEASAASSVILVEEVSLCTRAYEIYTFPSIPDPFPLACYSPGHTSSLLNVDVLWAPAARLGQAEITLADLREDSLSAYEDGPADAVLQETFDQSKVALLNVPEWVLYDGVGTTFICADNLAPVGPGTTTNINLQT